MRQVHRSVYRSTLAALSLLAVLIVAPTCPEDPSLIVVFGAEACRLVGYDKHDAYANQTVVPRASNGGLDLNAQICFFPDGSGWFVSGEDTGQPTTPAGFGILQLQGYPGAFTANQIGKLTPTYQSTEISQPENYGCGILSDGRVLTADIGDQYPPAPGNGQLILWFPPYDVWSDAPYDGANKVKYCKLDIEIETPGGIYVDADDNIYLASNRPSLDGSGNPDLAADGPGGVLKYSPPYPTSNDAAGGCGQVDVTGAPLADSINRELLIPSNYALGVLTASAIAEAPNGNLYVSSVFNGRIAEFDLSDPNLSLPPPAGGIATRYIVEPPPGESPPFATNGTPFGVAVDPDDEQVYYADLGIAFVTPVPGQGDVYRVPFDGLNEPLDPIKINDAPFNYPEGIAVLERAMLVHPSPSAVRVGEQKQFSVVPVGLGYDVTWSVEEGAAGGSIDANGLYTAPAVRPADGRAHVLAQSNEDNSVVGRAPVHIRRNSGR